jgi:hypothetical protein
MDQPIIMNKKGISMDGGENWMSTLTTSELQPGIEFLPQYPKEAVEHLVDQLLKLQQSYNVHNTSLSSKTQLDKAMNTINKAIATALSVELELK